MINRIQSFDNKQVFQSSETSIEHVEKKWLEIYQKRKEESWNLLPTLSNSSLFHGFYRFVDRLTELLDAFLLRGQH